MTAKSVLFLSLVGLLFTVSSLAAPPPDPDEDELPLNVGDGEWEKLVLERTERHLKAWLAAEGGQRIKEAGSLAYYAWRAERLDLIDRVIADDRLAETEVKVPEGAVSIPITSKHEAHVHHSDQWPAWIAPVWRRITASSFEIWTPTEGWLFGKSGRLLYKATPPRQTGLGRQWFGAFLPNGQWITTELLQSDSRIYVFNVKGRCTREIKVRTLIPPPGADDGKERFDLIPWARSNRKGDAWIVRVGSEEGRGQIVLQPDGSWSQIKAPSSPWKHCLARELGVRLAAGISIYASESDDGTLALRSFQPSHGMYVGRPVYKISRVEADLWEAPASEVTELGSIPGEGRGFGFWPGSHAVYVMGTKRTWFFNAKGEYQGWIAGRRVGDAANGRDMLFCLADGRVVAVSPELKAGPPQRYVLPDGASPVPVELHPDIALGVFALPRGENRCGEPDFEGSKEEDLSVEAMGDVGYWLSQRRGILLGAWKADGLLKKP